MYVQISASLENKATAGFLRLGRRYIGQTSPELTGCCSIFRLGSRCPLRSLRSQNNAVFILPYEKWIDLGSLFYHIIRSTYITLTVLILPILYIDYTLFTMFKRNVNIRPIFIQSFNLNMNMVYAVNWLICSINSFIFLHSFRSS